MGGHALSLVIVKRRSWHPGSEEQSPPFWIVRSPTQLELKAGVLLVPGKSYKKLEWISYRKVRSAVTRIWNYRLICGASKFENSK